MERKYNGNTWSMDVHHGKIGNSLADLHPCSKAMRRICEQDWILNVRIK